MKPRQRSLRSDAGIPREHGFRCRGTRSKTYQSWCDMRRRCTNPHYSGFKNYGGRGITVCERWEVFANFLADLGERPEGMSLERADFNGNYEPANCRWATRTEQNRNSRFNKLNEEKVRMIFRLRQEGRSGASIAREIGVVDTTVLRVLAGESWA